MKESTTEPGAAGGNAPASRGGGVLKKVKGVAKWVGKGFIPPVGAVKRIFGPGVAGELFKKSKGRICVPRNPNAPGAPDVADFGQVLDAWGIAHDEREIRGVISGLRKRCAMACIMAAIFIAVTLSSWEGRTMQFLVVGMCFVMIAVTLVTHIWRIRVLSDRKFVFFHHWLSGRR